MYILASCKYKGSQTLKSMSYLFKDYKISAVVEKVRQNNVCYYKVRGM